MAEALAIPQTSDKGEIYQAIIPQIDSVIAEEPDLIANLANIAAIIKEAFDYLWVGFYRMQDGELVLGPFQGPLACTRIALPKGVCGACATRKETILVPDVEKFPGHIACSSLSKSEIVVPLLNEGNVELILDVDSVNLEEFSELDAGYFEQIVELIRTKHFM